MPDDQVTRRLAAILATDIVGYSRLMEADEVGTLSRIKSLRREVVDPAIAFFHGRVVKTTGDGMLVEFGSAKEAVDCAVAIQRTMTDRNRNIDEGERIVLRMGINVGDIIFDSGDIFGDGVNVAARLEALCEPGGLCIARSVHDQVVEKMAFAFDDLGEQTVKNIARPIRLFGIGPGAIAALPSVTAAIYGSQPAREDHAPANELRQDIRFCLAPDGAQIAYSTVGSGPPLVKAPNWMSHLEFEWRSPIWKHVMEALAAGHTLVRFDQRGNGLSDWDAEELSLDAFVSDLESVVDTLKLEQFPLLGISQGCAISIAYAVRHPERVKCLILYGGFARGPFRRSPEEREKGEALLTLIRLGWGQDNPAFRQMFTSGFLPEGTHEQMEWFNELQRVSASAENAARIREAVYNFDVSPLLKDVACPTLVLHCMGDAVVPFREGQRMAAGIPGARFVSLEGVNHLILEHEPSWPRFIGEVRGFLSECGA